MSVIVLPYLGSDAAREELSRAAPEISVAPSVSEVNPLDVLDGLNMRLTYRTLRVLSVIGAHPGASNREIATAAEITDQGQISKLLSRLENLGLVNNTGQGQSAGAPNAWLLTSAGKELAQSADSAA